MPVGSLFVAVARELEQARAWGSDVLSEIVMNLILRHERAPFFL